MLMNEELSEIRDILESNFVGWVLSDDEDMPFQDEYPDPDDLDMVSNAIDITDVILTRNTSFDRYLTMAQDVCKKLKEGSSFNFESNSWE